jgi:hypothetical protein
MTIKIKDIQLAYNVPANRVKQIKSMQLFIVETSYLGRLLVSYKTTIGVFHNSIWYLTSEKFSPTTSKQTTMFANSTSFKVERVSPETFDDLLMAIGKV